MFRGTTPTFYFKLENLEDFSTISDVWITFRNDDANCNSHSHICSKKETSTLTKKLSKEEVALDSENKTVTVKLAQAETLRFKDTVFAQLKFLFTDDTVSASPIFKISVENILNQAIMKNEEPADDDDDETPETPGEDTPSGGETEGEGEEDTTPSEGDGETEETPDPPAEDGDTEEETPTPADPEPETEETP